MNTGLEVKLQSLITALALCPWLVTAQELYTLNNGEVADADLINHNFSALEQRLSEVSSSLDRNLFANSSFHEVPVDCSSNPAALEDIFHQTAHLDPVAYIITGTCAFDTIINSRKVLFEGNGGATGNVITPSLQPEQGTFNSFGVTSSTVLLSNITLDTTYVSSYADGYIRADNLLLTNSDERYSPYIYINIRSNSVMRLFSFAQTATQPSLSWAVTNSELMIQTSSPTALGSVSGKLGARIWCKSCNDASFESLNLTLNSSFCGSWSDDVQPVLSLSISQNSSFLGNSRKVFEGDPDQASLLESKDDSSTVLWDWSYTCAQG